METLAQITGTAIGTELKTSLRNKFGSFAYLVCRGEMLPRKENQIVLDPLVRDRYGLPVLRFNFQWSEQDYNQVGHMRQTLHDMVGAAGGRILSNPSLDPRKTISTPGKVIHEVGTARMAADPQHGVLNSQCESWDVPNLYVIDGAAFTSNPEKNPTLTIMALAWRASEHVASKFVRRAA